MCRYTQTEYASPFVLDVTTHSRYETWVQKRRQFKISWPVPMSYIETRIQLAQMFVSMMNAMGPMRRTLERGAMLELKKSNERSGISKPRLWYDLVTRSRRCLEGNVVRMYSGILKLESTLSLIRALGKHP